jgi:predicted aldo/keto reductase-like oxidoreductase
MTNPRGATRQEEETMELSKIAIGAMRVKDRASAVATFRAAIDAGFNYVDTSPCYCRQSEAENSESWTGEAVAPPEYRRRVMVSTKCSPGDGGLGLGAFRPEGGFGVRSAAQLRQVFQQSLRRLKLDAVDWYHLWTTHTHEQLREALKPGGWMEGVMALRDRWQHLGLTTHAESKTVIEFLETGRFEAVTIPLNVVNNTRLAVVDYAAKKGIRVIAMNPLAGGFLAADERLKELALRYLMRLPNVHVLIGFTSPEEVAYARRIEETMPQFTSSANDILAEVSVMMSASEPRCTACGYCQPCPKGINVGASLSYYNVFKYLGIGSARKAFLDKQWEDGLRLNRCVSCGECESRCPNRLPVKRIIQDALRSLYGTAQPPA